MKKAVRKIITFGLVSVILFSTSATAFAEEGDITHENEPKVVIGDTDIPVPDYIIKEIINENPNAGQINITECEKSDINNSNLTNQRMALAAGIYYTDVVKTVTNSSMLVKTAFVTSVAKGETITLGYSWSSSLECSISGTIDATSLGIKASVQKNYSASQTFSGPAEGSNYNSRSYYVRFYQDNGTYTANCHDPLFGWYITYPVSGSYTEPTYFVSYSIDSTVH